MLILLAGYWRTAGWGIYAISSASYQELNQIKSSFKDILEYYIFKPPITGIITKECKNLFSFLKTSLINLILNSSLWTIEK
ncbi:hypothetical protein BpHYR1_040723 [Brachionus plicatilis]|uniref:Uncharacterized protein n=1 Tax=Brachionus plicatilis TaxID=10195 RepID=A0A3M7P2T6_BRAPC|nr:hypothetical protein BpHYR1_040723 [Brachionus plicatilis]